MGKEKRFDIDIEEYANSVDAIKLLDELRLEQYNPEHVKDIFGDVLKDMANWGEHEAYRSLINLFSYSKYLTEMKFNMLELRKRAIKVLNVSSNNDLKHFYTSYISIEAEFFATHHNYHYSIINSFIDKYDYKKFHKAEYANSNYFNSLKISDPYTENEELYKDLYYYFFVDLTNGYFGGMVPAISVKPCHLKDHTII